MRPIGKFYNRQIFWFDFNDFAGQLPDKYWVCLAIANSEPDIDTFGKFVRKSISRNILEFKGHGQFGKKLHDLFDETMVIMETLENHREINILTTWDNDRRLADDFWQCFFATCLPDTPDIDNIKVVCTDLDGINRIDELKKYIKEFELGWVPSENVKHEVWEDPEGMTALCKPDKPEEDYRHLLEPGSKLIHTFYANSHYEAMTLYYKYMDWGIYTTEFEIDKQPYEKKNAT